MQTQPSRLPPKPVTEILRPELTRLPERTIWRRLLRFFLRMLARLLILVCTRAEVNGLENFPARGPAMIISNHLGDADAVLHLAFLPILPDAFAKIEMYDFPFLGKLMEAYGVIWVHRGRPDRRAITAALRGFKDGHMIAIAPEGRYSLSGGLEQGTGGAAYLAFKSGVPVIPVALTGTHNENVYGNLKRLRRGRVSFTVGEPFYLNAEGDRHEAVRQGTMQIMEALADLLPDEYRGFYQLVESSIDGDQ